MYGGKISIRFKMRVKYFSNNTTMNNNNKNHLSNSAQLRISKINFKFLRKKYF